MNIIIKVKILIVTLIVTVNGIAIPDCKDRPVGVLYSGGGIRALQGGISALSALKYVELPDEKKKKTVFDRTRAIGAVSGGSWSLGTLLGSDFNLEDVRNRIKEASEYQRYTPFNVDPEQDDWSTTCTSERFEGEKCCMSFGDLRQSEFGDQCKKNQVLREQNAPAGSNLEDHFATCDEVPLWSSLGSAWSSAKCHGEWTGSINGVFRRLWSGATCKTSNAEKREGAGVVELVDSDEVEEVAGCTYGWNNMVVGLVNGCQRPVPIISADVWNYAAKYGSGNPEMKGSGGPMRMNFGGLEFFRPSDANGQEMTGGVNYIDGQSIVVPLSKVQMDSDEFGWSKYTTQPMSLLHQMSYSSSAWSQVRVGNNGTPPRKLLICDEKPNVLDCGKEDFKNFAKKVNPYWKDEHVRIADSGAHTNLAFHTLVDLEVRDVIAFDFGDWSDVTDASSNQRHDVHELFLAMKYHFNVDLESAANKNRVLWMCATTLKEAPMRCGVNDNHHYTNLVFARIFLANTQRFQRPADVGVLDINAPRARHWETITYFPMRGYFKDGDAVAYVPDHFPTIGGNAYVHDTKYRKAGIDPNFFTMGQYSKSPPKTYPMLDFIDASTKFYKWAMVKAGFTAQQSSANDRFAEIFEQRDGSGDHNKENPLDQLHEIQLPECVESMKDICGYIVLDNVVNSATSTKKPQHMLKTCSNDVKCKQRFRSCASQCGPCNPYVKEGFRKLKSDKRMKMRDECGKRGSACYNERKKSQIQDRVFKGLELLDNMYEHRSHVVAKCVRTLTLCENAIRTKHADLWELLDKYAHIEARSMLARMTGQPDKWNHDVMAKSGSVQQATDKLLKIAKSCLDKGAQSCEYFLKHQAQKKSKKSSTATTVLQPNNPTDKAAITCIVKYVTQYANILGSRGIHVFTPFDLVTSVADKCKNHITLPLKTGTKTRTVKHQN